MTFRLFGFPIRVDTSAWLVFGFVVLSRAGLGPAGLKDGVIRAGVLLASILVHELGHALVARRLGLGPVGIMIHGFGGLTASSRSPTPRQGLLMTAAGPGAGLLLAVAAAAGLLLLPRTGGTMGGILAETLGINLFWSLFNLVPLHPLDGGMLLGHGLMALGIEPGRVMSTVRWVSLASAAIVGVWAVLSGWWFLLVVVGLAAVRHLKPPA
jgi:stage IV sporulation protein FB